jgi:hypothetical protein
MPGADTFLREGSEYTNLPICGNPVAPLNDLHWITLNYDPLKY